MTSPPTKIPKLPLSGHPLSPLVSLPSCRSPQPSKPSRAKSHPPIPRSRRQFAAGDPSPPAMSDESPAAAPQDRSPSPDDWQPSPSPVRKTRLPRACTARAPARFQPEHPAPEPRSTRRDKNETPVCRIVTPLVGTPTEDQLPRWELRSMWELASVLNFLHVFRPKLSVGVEFSAEELETAIITPNSTLEEIHTPLIKAIPPVIRIALGRTTWVSVMCRKLRDWWHWVADGEMPIVASHGEEGEAYKALNPKIRLLILKALCDIRVEQEDVRGYIDNSLKQGIQLSAFRRERIGGDSYGISYWYEDDPVIGHRLYREIRHVEGKKGRTKGSEVVPITSNQWETVATNLDEFQEVSDKLLSSKNRTEISLGKRLKIDILPEIEKNVKRKERALKKQHRQALLLDSSFITGDELSSGRSLRDRRPVTYTFDDYDRSINEAIKVTKRRPTSPELIVKKEVIPKTAASSNGTLNGTPPASEKSNGAQSPKSNEYEGTDEEEHQADEEDEQADQEEEQQAEPLDRSNRRRKRPQRYSEQEYVQPGIYADFDSDDEIVGEAVYDEEYLRSRKQKKTSSSSEGDEEYRWEDKSDEEEEEEVSLSVSEDSDEQESYKKFPTRSRRAPKVRSVGELQSGLRRSKRSTRPRIDYRQLEMSDSESDSVQLEKSNGVSDASNDIQFSAPSQDSMEDDDDVEMKDEKMIVESAEKVPCEPVEKTSSPGPEFEGPRRRRFLDLNELAPGTGFDDGLNSMKDDGDDL